MARLTLLAWSAFWLFSTSSPAYGRDGHELEAAFRLSSLSYREDFPPPGKSEESGFLPGVALEYSYLGRPFPVYARLVGELATGTTTYDGAIDANGAIIPFKDRSSHVFTRLEGQIGYALLAEDIRAPMVILFLGYGYRSWIRQLPGPGGYEEDYSWTYIPAGVRLSLQLSSRWDLSMECAARFMTGGTITIRLPQFNNPTLTLGNRFGWRLAVPVSCRLNAAWSVVASAWYEYSAIGESNNSSPVNVQGILQYVKEPSSNTRLGGIDVGIRFRF